MMIATTPVTTFVHSQVFSRTFRDGMALVEETANYLDGEGREASKSLGREASLTYASSSMRLTTQLMQIASWLLVLRAVREDEMQLSEAQEEKYRVRISRTEPDDLEAFGLPPRLLSLIEDTDQLFERIARLDRDLFCATRKAEQEINDAASQQRALMKAFGE